MFVAWSGRVDSEDARTHWPEHPRLAVAPGAARLGVAAANSKRVTLHVRDALAAVAVSPAWGPDAAAVADAYARHERRLGRHLEGDFATVVLDFDRQTLFGTSS